VARFFVRGEPVDVAWNSLDKAVFYWAGAMMLVPCIVNPGQIVWVSGFFLDNVIEYVVLRILLRDESSVKTVALWMLLLSVPLCAGMPAARTERGRRIVRRAIAAGYVELKPAAPWKLLQSQKNLIEKRGAVGGA
jgi:hypothetical protein